MNNKDHILSQISKNNFRILLNGKSFLFYSTVIFDYHKNLTYFYIDFSLHGIRINRDFIKIKYKNEDNKYIKE